MTTLCVVGAGPKGVALACKSAALLEAGYKSVPKVIIVEQMTIGATWAGKQGYTDGRQPLCTPAKRDIGFPYDKSPFGSKVAEILHREYSWSAYCLDPNTAPSMDEWVSRGQRPPTHRQFSQYLTWALGKAQSKHPSEIELVTGKVTEFSVVKKKWEVVVGLNTKPATTRRIECTGIVFTGSTRRRSSITGAGNLPNGKTFWSSDMEVRRSDLVEKKVRTVVVAGSGGTAAAVAMWLVNAQLKHVQVQIVGNQPTIHARVANFFEDRMFSDDEAWRLLSEEAKEQFLTRLSRGSVWACVATDLGSSRSITYVCDWIKSVTRQGDEYKAEGVRDNYPCDYFVDATGFDDWWFIGIAAGTLQTELKNVKEAGRKDPNNPAKIVHPTKFDQYLCLSGCEGVPIIDGLHLPMLSGMVGPASSNLMALGWMADRVIGKYIDANEIRWRI